MVYDLRFTDWPGVSSSTAPSPISADRRGHVFEDGLGFDGSSIRGWQAINESDMLMVPDPDNTAFIDPFFQHPTLVTDSATSRTRSRGEPYSRDPRYIAKQGRDLPQA